MSDWEPEWEKNLPAFQKIMREQELQRRAARTKIMQNHIKLTEDLSPEEKTAFRVAATADDRGYWKRLWDALLGRK